MEVQIKEVYDLKNLRKFVKFQNDLYKNCSYYVPKLFSKELNTLDKNKNPAYDFCEARFWIAHNDNEIIGRIAGVLNHKCNIKSDKKYIRFGWFDVINDQDTANKLLECVEKWGKEVGAEYIHGPLGFISFDTSGVLIEGFDEISTSFGSYNYSYYNNLIINAGYQKQVDWIEYYIKLPDETPKKFFKASELVKKKYGLKNAELKNKKHILKYSDSLFDLVNKSYNDLFGFVELSPKVIEKLKKSFLSFLNPDYTSIIINENDEVFGFGIAILSLAKAIQKSQGRLFPFGYFHILKALKNNDTADLILIGIHADYQNKGVHSLIFEKIISNMLKNNIKYVNATRSLEDNKVKNLWSDYENKQNKKVRCYIKKL